MTALATIDRDMAVALFGEATVRVLAKRAEQVALGHTPAADDATGPHQLIELARHWLRQAERTAMAASDQTIGQVAALDPRCRDTLENRCATIAALAIAALETIHSIPRPEGQHAGEAKGGGQ